MGEFGRAEPDAVCPVSLDLLGELYRADADDTSEMLRDMTEDRRARLALYCYSKAHMRSLALTIAASCDAERLAQLAGTLGQVLAAQCRAKVRDYGIAFQPPRAVKRVSLGSCA